MKRVTFIAAVLVLATNAHAINRCIGPNGKAVFQDAPCAGQGGEIEVRPSTGAPPPPPPSNPAAKQKPDSSTELRRIELETYLVKNKRDQVNGANQDCQNQLARLADSKKYASNNLAGAVYESSISSEMQSVATMCQSKTAQLRAELAELERELREIKSRR